MTEYQAFVDWATKQKWLEAVTNGNIHCWVSTGGTVIHVEVDPAGRILCIAQLYRRGQVATR